LRTSKWQRWVIVGFRNTVRFLAGRLALIAFGLLFSSLVRGAQPTAESLGAWKAHVAQARAALDQCAQANRSFLLIAQNKPVERRIRQGRIVVIHTAGGGMLHVPDGLIHDWTGAVFIPGARAADVTAVLQNYEAYAATYRPAVAESHLLASRGNEFRYRLKFQSDSFGIKAGLLGEFDSSYWTGDAQHNYSTTEAIRLVELADPGTPHERPLAPDEAHGYIQRMFTIVRYTEADGGVLVEVEAMSLSRDIPGAVRWAVTPFVERFSRQVLTTTLEKFRARVSSTLTQSHSVASATHDCVVNAPGC
jgi:hypothetical protein